MEFAVIGLVYDEYPSKKVAKINVAVEVNR